MHKKINNLMADSGHLILMLLLLTPILLVTKPLDGLLSAIFLVAAVWLIKGQKWTRILILPLATLSLLQFGNYLYCARILDKYFWMSMYSTAYSESLSFFDALSGYGQIALILYTIGSLYCLYYFFCGKNISRPLEKVVGLLACATIFCQALIAHDPAQYLNIREALRSTYFSKILSTLDSAVNFTVSTKPIALQKSDKEAPAGAILVVLGESASRLRMGDYGYTKDTTPMTEPDAHLFRDAVAVGLNTQPNVQALFTGLVNSDPQRTGQNIFRIARMMGYKTIFLDNNGYQHEDPVIKMASTSDIYISMNSPGQLSAKNDDKIKYDEVLFKPFSTQLKKHGPGKIIYILHISGSHPSQNKRYPKSFDKFSSYYDNSIFYTDYILNRLKTMFMNAMENTAVAIYVSDHGVQLPPGCGLGKIPAPENLSYGANDRFFSNYAVPLIVWANPAFKTKSPEKFRDMLANLAKPIDHRFLLYTLSDLMGVKSVNQTPVENFSIFSPKSNFMPRNDVDGYDIDQQINQGSICRAN